MVRSEEGEKSIAVGFIRMTLSLACILAGQVGGFGAAMGSRNEALELERVWLGERKARALSLRNG